MMWFKVLKIFFVVGLWVLTSYVYAQDGLDENSFEQEADTSQQQEGETTGRTGTVNPTENPSEESQNAPVDDINPNELSNRIKNLTPEVLTSDQDYFPSFIYDDRGRKDPFAPRLKVREKVVGVTETDLTEEEERVLEGLSKYEISALTLTAILIGKQSKPKALIKDPAGAVYVIHENDKIGRNNGVVRKIRSGQVVIVEYREKEGERLYTTQVLSLGK